MQPVEYQHLMRTVRHGWWRPFVALLLVGALLLLVVILLQVGFWIAGLNLRLDMAESEQMPAGSFALVNLLLASFIAIAMWSARIVHGLPAGFLSSIAGRLRWRWMWHCLLIALPVFVVYFCLDLIFDPPQTPRPDQWALLLLAVLVGTPFQAAGEEYLCRGLILQGVGAWCRTSRAALVLGTAVSTTVFVSLHGSADPWIVLDLGIIGVACAILTWRTGGLESAIVLHAANNVLGMATSIVFGGWGEGFVQENSKGSPVDPLMTLVVCGVVVPLMLRRAAQLGIQRVYLPADTATARIEAAPRSAMSRHLPATAMALMVLGLNLAVVGAETPASKPQRLPPLRYADIAKRMGVTADGCLRGNRLESLPMEIRRYASRELVGDDARLVLGDFEIAGRDGVFPFPLSAQWMQSNPNVWVVLPDGRKIDYRYKFITATVKSMGPCEA